MPIAMGADDQATAWQTGSALVARIGDRRLAFAVGEVDNVAPLAPLWRPPTLPRPIAGFLPYRGRALPVLDAARLLGLGESGRPDLYAHILILPIAGTDGAGLLVDRVETLVEIGDEERLPIDPADTLNGCAVGLAEVEDRPVHLVTATRLLAAAEAATLSTLAAAASARLAEWGTPA
jgi:purine-binding chemotaxis protein CheW